MELEKSVETYLKTGSWRGLTQDNPVQTERGVTYVRHNGIRIGNVQDSGGGVLVSYLWNGLIVGWIRIQGTRLQDNRHHIEQTVEGRHRVTPG